MVGASLIILALVGTSLGLIEARRQEREARRLKNVVVAEAHKKEIARQAEAEKRLGQVAKANEILGSIFKDLDPRQSRDGRKPLAALLGDRLDQATAAIEGEAIGDTVAVARRQRTLGQSRLSLGYPEKAIGLFTMARATFTARPGPDHPKSLATTNDLAVGYLTPASSTTRCPPRGDARA